MNDEAPPIPLRATIQAVRTSDKLPEKKHFDYGGLEISWFEPVQVERGFLWVRYGRHPWVKIHAPEGTDEENEILARMLKK